VLVYTIRLQMADGEVECEFKIGSSASLVGVITSTGASPRMEDLIMNG
jgi:hypothetical protein